MTSYLQDGGQGAGTPKGIVQPLWATHRPVLPAQGPRRWGKGVVMGTWKKTVWQTATGRGAVSSVQATASPRRCHRGVRRRHALPAPPSCPPVSWSNSSSQRARELFDGVSILEQREGQSLDLRNKQNNQHDSQTEGTGYIRVYLRHILKKCEFPRATPLPANNSELVYRDGA